MTKTEIKNVDYFVVDFDRTLVNTDKLLEVFVEISDTYFNISREQLLKAEVDVRARGDSNDIASYVRDHLISIGRGEEWADLEKRFIHESRSFNYMLPGAAELLEWLAANGKRFGILTYGNPLWQRLKLTAAGFNHEHHIVMEYKEKGRFISNWQRSDGTFRIPDSLGQGTADSIVMLDDKAISFSQFPLSPSKGFWVLDPAHELPSQQGSVPTNVTRCKDLYAVIDALED